MAKTAIDSGCLIHIAKYALLRSGIQLSTQHRKPTCAGVVVVQSDNVLALPKTADIGLHGALAL